MKEQRFRCKVIALLLMVLLGWAALHGARTIPVTMEDSSLRDAIRTATGQTAMSPEAMEQREASPTPDSGERTTVPDAYWTGATAAASPASKETETSVSEAVQPTPAPPLIQFFSAETAKPDDSPWETPLDTTGL